jgi:hypothetical protein
MTVLTKNHVVVHTASINVKILRLEKKQVTLSVFRQLDEESVFLSDGTFRGQLWGRVNYTWKGNQAGTAFHVVWQKGDRLMRSCVPDLTLVTRAYKGLDSGFGSGYYEFGDGEVYYWAEGIWDYISIDESDEVIFKAYRKSLFLVRDLDQLFIAV